MSCTRSTPHGSSQSRCRPRGDDQSEKSNKKKKGVDKLVASLENISVAMIGMVKLCHEKAAAEKAAAEKATAEKATAEKAQDKDELLCDAINAVTELDLGTRLRAKDLFGNHIRLANALISEKEKDRATVIKFFLDKYG